MGQHTFKIYKSNIDFIEIEKRSYNTLDDAIFAAKLNNSKENTIHKYIAYKCDVCYKYHIGKSYRELKEKDRIKYKKELKSYGFKYT